MSNILASGKPSSRFRTNCATGEVVNLMIADFRVSLFGENMFAANDTNNVGR